MALGGAKRRPSLHAEPGWATSPKSTARMPSAPAAAAGATWSTAATVRAPSTSRSEPLLLTAARRVRAATPKRPLRIMEECWWARTTLWIASLAPLGASCSDGAPETTGSRRPSSARSRALRAHFQRLRKSGGPTSTTQAIMPNRATNRAARIRANTAPMTNWSASHAVTRITTPMTTRVLRLVDFLGSTCRAMWPPYGRPRASWCRPLRELADDLDALLAVVGVGTLDVEERLAIALGLAPGRLLGGAGPLDGGLDAVLVDVLGPLDQRRHHLVLGDDGDVLPPDEQVAALAAGGDAEVGVLGLARPVDDAAHDRHLQRDLAIAERLLGLGSGLASVTPRWSG